MPTQRVIRAKFPVRPVLTWDFEAVNAPVLPVSASSKTAAIRACRAAGYRVCGKGGLQDVCPTGPHESEEWCISVYPDPWTKADE